MPTGLVSGVAECVFATGVEGAFTSGIAIFGWGVRTFGEGGLISSSIGSTDVSLLASLMAWS